jgi:ribosomal protein S18 acetylase RimI-like enzyme
VQPEPLRREPGGAADLALRPATDSDLDFVLDLCRRVFQKYGSYDRYLADWLRAPYVSTWIAELDSVPAGFFMLAIHREDEHTAELLSIAVVPELRSRGIGSALLDRAIAIAFEAAPEVREIRLSVAEGNARAQRMFARRGFRIGPAVGIYPAGQRALFMSKVRKPT